MINPKGRFRAKTWEEQETMQGYKVWFTVTLPLHDFYSFIMIQGTLAATLAIIIGTDLCVSATMVYYLSLGRSNLIK